MKAHYLLSSLILISACGPSALPMEVDAGVCVPVGTVEFSCFDGRDDDCDHAVDCADPDCLLACDDTQFPDAATCGEANFGGDPLAIPDGVGMSYETTLTISGFDPGQTLQDTSGIRRICVVMEHSWLRDLQIEFICPSGTVLVLSQFLGQVGGEVFMGEPNDSDVYDPIPGIGYQYCWTPTATNAPMLEWANANLPLGSGTLPPGDYQASGDFNSLIGCELNGTWRWRATDDWAIDNGFVFSWLVEFNSNIIPNCDDWIVE